MWLENNSSFEDISPQINKKSEAETIIDMDKIDKSKNITKINDILVLLEWKIDDNQENQLRKVLNTSDFKSLNDFLDDHSSISELQNINDPGEILIFFKNKFDNNTKGGEGIDSWDNLDLINSKIDDINNQILLIESKGDSMTTKDKRERYALNKKLKILEDNKTDELIKKEDDITKEVIKNKQEWRKEVIKTKDTNIDKKIDNNEQNLYLQEKVKLNLDKIKSSLPDIILDKHSDIKNLLIQSSNTENTPEWNKEKEKILNKILNILKNPAKLKTISDDLEKYDKENNTNTLNDFKSSLISIDSSFRESFDKLDDTNSKSMILLGTDNNSWVDIWKNTLSKQTDDGFEIEAWSWGRKLSINGSDYKLEASIDNQDEINQILEIDNRFKSDINELNTELSSLSSIINYIDEANANKLSIDEIKQTIKTKNNSLYNELNLDSLTNISEIKLKISWEYNKKEEEKDKILKEKKALVDELISRNSMEAKEIDENKKETLRILEKTWFDLLPQNITNQLINEYKSNIFSIPWTSFNKETMDLSNGRFGETSTEKWWDAWKNNLVKFMEKAIYGEVWGKDSIFAWKNFKGEFTLSFQKSFTNLLFT